MLTGATEKIGRFADIESFVIIDDVDDWPIMKTGIGICFYIGRTIIAERKLANFDMSARLSNFLFRAGHTSRCSHATFRQGTSAR